MTTIFLDTEFSDLEEETVELISVGAITATGRTFYVELSPRPAVVSDFVRKFVLPLLEEGDAACPRTEFAARFAKWLAQWPEPHLIVDSEWDIYVLRKTLVGAKDWQAGELMIAGEVCASIGYMPPLPDSELVRYFDAKYAQKRADPRVHHALADAVVLRAGGLARRDWS